MQNMRKNKFNANMRKNMRYALCMKIRALIIDSNTTFRKQYINHSKDRKKRYMNHWIKIFIAKQEQLLSITEILFEDSCPMTLWN